MATSISPSVNDLWVLAGLQPPAAIRRAAQYLRMSTDHQRYSIENQKLVIGEYALLHGFKIVRTYADEGLSGLTIRHRDALQQLINDVEWGRADFETILVYDVSRWGRFQDVDESAYYEYICKSVGVSVVYCTEMFENDGSIFGALVKAIKRAMAAEYSRELSDKVVRSHRYYAERGFHQGGAPNYGLRRMLVDASGHPKMELVDGQEKNLHGDRIILVPGPKSETDVVREVFRLYAKEDMSQKEIARYLNKKGLLNRRGNPWSNWNVLGMLHNEKYAGTFVYCRSQWRLQEAQRRNPPQDWVRVEGAIAPIVDRDTFNAVQRRLKLGWEYSDSDLLNYLTAAWCNSGYLSGPMINRNSVTPYAVTYRARFGSLLNAYRMIGYRVTHVYRYSKAKLFVRRIHRDIICNLTSPRKDGGTILFDEERQVLVIDGTFLVAVAVVPYWRPKRTGLAGWKVHFDRLEPCNALLLARIVKGKKSILDLHLLPRMDFGQPSFRFTEETIKSFRRHKLKSLSAFYSAARTQMDIDSQAA